MPLIFAAILSFGIEPALGWRLAMVIPGVALFLCGILYYRATQDAPEGDLRDLRAAGKLPPAEQKVGGSFLEAIKDVRVWALFVIYGACFGVELTINNIAALYFHDSFELSLATAGLVASLFGLMNIFARTLGGVFGDRAGIKWGLRGRVAFLGAVILAEGLALLVFAQMRLLGLAIVTLVIFSLFVQMSEGATYAVVPSVNRKALGSVSGIVGAGGNAGAVAAGFLFRAESLSTATALTYLGVAVAASSVLTLVVRFSPEQEAAAKEHVESSLAAYRALASPAQPAE
jgi:NNP family nitrate/nitrite transporter-like MFS transporter